MNITLSNTRLFRGIGSDELPLLLQCLGAVQKHYDRSETILAEGARPSSSAWCSPAWP